MPPPRIHTTPLLTRLRILRPAFRASPFFRTPTFNHAQSKLYPPFPHLQSGSGTVSKKRILASWAVIVLSMHAFGAYFYTVQRCSGPSMLPTIPHGTAVPWFQKPLLFISRFYKRGKDVKVGDIVIYDIPMMHNSQGCKRIIGMPGDLVCVQTQNKVGIPEMDQGKEFGEYKEEMMRVPEGHCWLVGDNVLWSRDSRMFGPLPLNLVKGKVLAVAWPPTDAKWFGKESGLTDVKDGEHEWVAG